MAIPKQIADVWSATDFSNPDLTGYAETQIHKETRLGVQIMAGLALFIQMGVAVLLLWRGLDPVYIKTNLILGVLAAHILISASYVKDLRTLHMLGMTFLVFGALAITLLAHQIGELNVGMIAAIVMLFVAIPVVPWALREASLVIALTYLLLTSSLASVPGRFNSDSILALQLLIFGAAIIGFIITGRNTYVRKHDLLTRFDLEKTHKELELVSMQDHLTGAWNRRYLQEQFPYMARTCQKSKKTLHIAVLDVDNFKTINDVYGHQIGDHILVCIAKIFAAHIGAHGRLIRLGGDEFFIVYWGDDLDTLIERSIRDLQLSPVAKKIHGTQAVTLSAGMVSSDPNCVAELEFMYKTADKALYEAKKGKPSARPSNGPSEKLLTRTGSWTL
ncbi:MAG: GGDEF domain-containing protein [Woeseia sp.]|nr:GGDEF domain-containing protein [Woeseia sp.]NNE59562.1 GGDEF domain-containing protein [Woeseia sp.]